ncbi:uncharacterized protein LOC144125550 [Amblyomma americanum]|uniref:Cuticle protein n=1 Tax=Amblyomma americanum TaxID=6943 RepID=A0AAQ4F896_AMBAM
MILRTFALVALAVAASIRSTLAGHSFDAHQQDPGGFQTIVEGLSRPHLVEPQGTPVGISIVPLHHHHGGGVGYQSQPVAPVTVHVTQVGVHQSPVIGVSAPAGVREGALALHASHLLLNAVSSPGMVVHGAPVIGGAAYQPAAGVRPEPVAAVVPVQPAVRQVPEVFVPQPYQFGYEISDGYGNKQVRHEVSDGHNRKRGSYGFVDAHGVYRQVRYVADHNGFRATIDTNEPGVAAGYSAAAVFKVGHRPANPVVNQRPIPPPPHRIPVVIEDAAAANLVQKPLAVQEPALQAVQAVQDLQKSPLAVAPLPISSVEYSPGVEHSGGVDFIPSAPRLSAAITGAGLIDPRRSHVTYVEAPQEHPFANLRTSPPVYYERVPEAQKSH